MRITSKGRYGLKAMMELAGEFGQGRLVKLREIAEQHDIPQKYLEQIVNTLKKNQLVTSARGAEGGYRLSRAPDQITVLEILRALEGDLSIIDKNDSTWDTEQGLFWQELDTQIRKLLDIPLTEFLSSKQDGSTELMYYI